MTPERLAEIERLATLAWPGEWAAEHQRIELPDVNREPWEPIDCPDEATAAYIAAANPATVLDLIAHIRDLEAQVREAREAKDYAYRQRDQLVAALSKVFPSGLGRHPDSDTTWEDDWRNIVYIEFPTGQSSWHIHDSEMDWFKHLPPYWSDWDGHTDDEKYDRIADMDATATPPSPEVGA